MMTYPSAKCLELYFRVERERDPISLEVMRCDMEEAMR